MRAQADLDIAQTFASGEWSEGHAQERVQASKSFHGAVAVELGDEATKRMHRQVLHELRKHKVAFVHDDIL